MTPWGMEHLIEDAQREARGYLAKIISVLDLVPDESISELTPHLKAALVIAKRNLKAARKENGHPPDDTSTNLPAIEK